MASDEREIIQLETVEDGDRCSSRNSNKAAAVAAVAMLPPADTVVTNGVNGHGGHEVNGRGNGHVEEEEEESGELQINGNEKDYGGDQTSALQADGANFKEATEAMPESTPADGVHSVASSLSDGLTSAKTDDMGSLEADEAQDMQGKSEKVPSCHTEEKDADKNGVQMLPALIGEDATAIASSSGEAFIVVKSAEESDSTDGEKCTSSANNVMEDKVEEEEVMSPPLGNDPGEREVEKGEQESPTGAEVLGDVNSEIEETASPPRKDETNTVGQHIESCQTPKGEVESILVPMKSVDAAATKEAHNTSKIFTVIPESAETDSPTPEVLELAKQSLGSSGNAESGVEQPPVGEATEPPEPLLVPSEVDKTSEAAVNDNESQEASDSSCDGKDGNEIAPEVVTGRLEVALKEDEKVAVVDNLIETVHFANDLLIDVVQELDLEKASTKVTEEVIVASLTLSDNTVRENVTLQQENVTGIHDGVDSLGFKQEIDGIKEKPAHTEDAKSTHGEIGISNLMTDPAASLNLGTEATSGVVHEVNRQKGLPDAGGEGCRSDNDESQIIEAELPQSPGLTDAMMLPNNEPHEFDVFRKDKVGAVAEEKTAVEELHLMEQLIKVPETVSNVSSEVKQEVDLVGSIILNADAGNLLKEQNSLDKAEVKLVPEAPAAAKDFLLLEQPINDLENVASTIETTTSNEMDLVDNDPQCTEAAMLGQDESVTEVHAKDEDLHTIAPVIPTEHKKLPDQEAKSMELVNPALESQDIYKHIMPGAADEERAEAAHQASTAQDLTNVPASEGSQQGKSDELDIQQEEKDEPKLDSESQSPEMGKQDVANVASEVEPQPNVSPDPENVVTHGANLLADISLENPTEPHLLRASQHGPIQPAPPLDMNKVQPPLDTHESDFNTLDLQVHETQQSAVDNSGAVAGSGITELANSKTFDIPNDEVTDAVSEPKVPMREAPPIPIQIAPSVCQNDPEKLEASAMKKDDDIEIPKEVQQSTKQNEPDQAPVDQTKVEAENAPFVVVLDATDDTNHKDVSAREYLAPEHDLQDPNSRRKEPGPPCESEPDITLGGSQVADMPANNDMTSEQNMNVIDNWAKSDNSFSGASFANDPGVVPETLPQVTETEKEVSIISLGKPLPEIVSTNEHAPLFDSSFSKENVPSEEMPLVREDSPLQSSHVQTCAPTKSGDGNKSSQFADENLPEHGSPLHESEPNTPTDGSNAPVNQTNDDVTSEQNLSTNINWAKFDSSPSGASNNNDNWVVPEPLPQMTEAEQEVSVTSLGEPSPAIVSTNEQTSPIDSSLIKENVPSEEMTSQRENSPLNSSHVQTGGLMKSIDGMESRQVEEMNIPTHSSPAHESKPDIPTDGSDDPDIQTNNDVTSQKHNNANDNWAMFDNSLVGANNVNDPWAVPEPLPQTSEVEKEVLVISLGEPLSEDVSNNEQPSIAVSSTTNGSTTITISTEPKNGDAIPDLNLKPEPEVVLTTATEATFTSKVTISEEHPSPEPKVPVRKASRVAPPPPPPKPQLKSEPEVVLSATEARFTSKLSIEEESPRPAADIDSSSSSSSEPKVPVRKAGRLPPPQALSTPETRESDAVTAPPRTASLASKAAETAGAELATETPAAAPPLAKPRRTTLERKRSKDGEGQSVISYLFGPCFSCFSKK